MSRPVSDHLRHGTFTDALDLVATITTNIIQTPHQSHDNPRAPLQTRRTFILQPPPPYHRHGLHGLLQVGQVTGRLQAEGRRCRSGETTKDVSLASVGKDR